MLRIKKTEMLAEKWPWVLTLLTIFLITILSLCCDIKTVKEISEIIGSIGTAIALFWIIAGYIQQRKELISQREELQLQRQALQQQVNEFQKSYNLALRQEITKMLHDAYNVLMNSGQFENFSQISMAVLMTPDWKIALESDEPGLVIEACKNYAKNIGNVEPFLRTYATAVKMYFEANSIQYVDNTNTSEFIYFYSKQIDNIYPFRDYSFSSYLAAEFLVIQDPGIKALQFAFFAATIQSVSPNILRMENLLKDYLFLKERNILPVIAKKVAHMFEDLI